MAERTDWTGELARAVQGGVPLVANPFAELGTRVGVEGTEVLVQLQRWQLEGLLREISAVMEGSRLGYESALVAARVAPERLEGAAGVVAEHPTVTHDYEREHRFNLWYTLAVPREHGLEAVAARLADLAGLEEHYVLPRTATFKIGVNFDLRTRRNHTSVQPPAEVRGVFSPTERERAMVRALQRPLPLRERPFAVLAAEAGVEEAELLRFARWLKSERIMRRYVGTLRHRRAGVRANGMACWRVPADRHAEVGPRIAAAPEVSHCYARPAFPGFPFSLYSMLHGPSRQDVLEVAERIAADVGIEGGLGEGYLVLFSVREFKKCRLRYFLPETEAWWRRHGQDSDHSSEPGMASGSKRVSRSSAQEVGPVTGDPR